LNAKGKFETPFWLCYKYRRGVSMGERLNGGSKATTGEAKWEDLAQATEWIAEVPDDMGAQMEMRRNEIKDTSLHMVRVGERSGSNDGGWYEDSETKERFYVKFYKNPDQARVEYVANAIYQKLGIRATHPQLTEVDGRFAIIMPEIRGASATTKDEQANSADVRNGFVADAYLANWDVAGLANDNLVRGDDGNIYRIDNGGSMIFRARGGHKDFAANNVPELTTMLDSMYSAGEIFKDVNESDIKSQAQKLVDKLSVQDIKEIVDTSGLGGEEKLVVLSGLIGRREFLMKRFELADTDRKVSRRFSEVLAAMRGHERAEECGKQLRSRKVVVCDRDHIEGQQIHIIDASDIGRLEIEFKLRGGAWQKAVALLEQRAVEGEEVRVDERITRCALGGNVKQVFNAPALGFRIGDCEVTIANANDSSCDERRAFLGMVQISLQERAETSAEEIERQIQKVLKVLGVDDGLEAVDNASEDLYKINSYLWHHKIKIDETEAVRKAALNLQRREVFPEYFAFVDEGKQGEYAKKYGDFVPICQTLMANDDDIIDMLQYGLMSSSERYRRGLFRNGMSTTKDFDTGGADSVFVRTIRRDEIYREGLKTGTILLNPTIYERTDWHAYSSDMYGSTSAGALRTSLSPEDLFNQLLDCTNEQMFRMGIEANAIDAVLVASEEERGRLVEAMKQRGIFQVGERKVEDLVQDRALFLEEVRKQSVERTSMKKRGIINRIEKSDFMDLDIEEIQGVFDRDMDDALKALSIVVDKGGKAAIEQKMHDFVLDHLTAYQLANLMTGIGDEGKVKMVNYMKTVLGMNLEELQAELKERENEESKKYEFSY
jgi:hypothetical protein